VAEGAVHVVGLGLAGLSAALRLAARGRRVRLWEAAGHAGGRCRSFDDARLGRRIDNGNHLVLSGNRAVFDYLRLAGAPDALRPAPAAAFPFVDLASGARWSVRMNRGPLPWWVAAQGRRIPGTRPADYASAFALLRAGRGDTVAEAVRARGPLWRGFWEPLTLAVLNMPPERASARLLGRVMLETFARGAAAARPVFAPKGLGAALVEPALARLRELGAEPRFNRPLRAIERADGRAAALVFPGETVTLGPADVVVLALPPSRLRRALPELDPPRDDCAILNAHFVVEDPAMGGAPPLIGVLGGQAQWIFTRGDVASVTVSAADALGLLERDRQALAAGLWAETRRALRLQAARPAAARILVERRATFDQSPAGVARRPQPRSPLTNVFLAGDAVDTGLPATIEGALRSGETAAGLAARAVPSPQVQARRA
jgi:squalene-associated FAD-dependent desaturase